MTYREILEITKSYFQMNKHVSQVFVCNDSDLNAIPNKRYPYVQIELNDITNNVNSKEFNLQLTIGDIITENLMNSGDDVAKSIIQSESYDTLMDYIDYMDVNSASYYVYDNPVFSPFEDEHNDRVYGLTVNVSIITIKGNKCKEVVNV